MTSTKEYQLACDNSNGEVRQRFLDSLDLEDAKAYIKTILYDPVEDTFTAKDGSRVNPDRVHMLTEYSLWTRIGFKHGKSTIRVFKGAFNNHNYLCLEDFLSNLIDHEGFHAKEHYEDPKSIVRTRETMLQSEIRALENQLNIIETGRRHCSKKHIENIRETLKIRYGQDKYC